MWIAAGLMAVAFPLQLLGLTSTCTQGADGTYLAGALLSSPMLFWVAVRVVRMGFAEPTRSSGGAVATGLTVVVLTLILLSLTYTVWSNVIVFGTPCGEDSSDLPHHLERQLVVLIGYLALPLLVASATSWMLVRHLR